MANEKRLIDYQKAIEIAIDTLKGKVTTVTAVMLTTRLKYATVDAVEVVRCKECAVPHNQWTGCPNLNGLVPPPDFYCAYGERKTDV